MTAYRWRLRPWIVVGPSLTLTALLGENLIEIPRHPKLNKVDEGSHAGREGRSGLFEVLLRWELYDDLIARSETSLGPIGNEDDETKRLRALGAAYFARSDAERGRICLAGLEMIHKKALEKKADEKDEAKKGREKRIKAAENALEELRGFAQEDPKAALAHFQKSEDLPRETLARAQLRAGETETAEKTARQAAEAAEGQAIPWAHYCEILIELGKTREALDAWKKLAPLVRHADPGLPVLRRIEPVTSRNPVELPPGKKVIENVERLGPLAWKPPAAPLDCLVGTLGESDLKTSADPSVLLIFYLGSKCTHCVQQLEKFSQMAADFRRANISIVAISTETPQEISAARARKTPRCSTAWIRR